MKKIILIGGFQEIIELCELAGYEVVGIIDNNPNTNCEHAIIGTDSNAYEVFRKYPDIPVAIVPDDPSVRKKLVNHYSAIGFKFENLISPKAILSRSARVGEGVVLQSGVNISANATIGKFVKINTLANIMHDCVVGDFSTVGPNAVLLGRVKVGESSYLGANCTILPEISVGHNVIVGAGAVVTKNVGDGMVVVGNPARPFNKIS